MINHHPTCTANYPEKPEGEQAQSETVIDLNDTTQARTCNDCGAFVLEKRERTFSDLMDQHPKHLRELEELREELNPDDLRDWVKRFDKVLNEMRRQHLEDMGVDTYGGQ